MAVMNEPGVRVALINASADGVMSRYDIVCIHTIVGHDPAPAAHFSTGGDGLITQSRDTRFRSAANFNGNHRVIAIENEDFGPPFPAWNVNDGGAIPAFTDAQCESIAYILAWCHKTHGIPLVFVTNSLPTTRGVSFHRAGIDGNFAGFEFGGRIAGGEVWSRAFGKTCPGDRRIRQVRDIIIPRARVLAGLVQGGNVATLDAEDLTNIRNAILNYRVDWPSSSGYAESHQLWELLSHPYYWTSDANKGVGRLESALAALQRNLDASELHILTLIRDPQNPATVDTVSRVLAGVTTIVEADQDNEVVVGPEHLQAFAEAVAALLPERIRPMLSDAVARVLTRGTEEYPETPPTTTG